MKLVQDALGNAACPVFPLAFRVTSDYSEPPEEYLVYTTRQFESGHSDDIPQYYTIYVYLNLWTINDPAERIYEVRRLMRYAGFGMGDEEVTFNDATGRTLVAWTWVIHTQTEDNELETFPDYDVPIVK